MPRLKHLFFLFVILSLILSACVGPPPAQPAQEAAPAQAAEEKGPAEEAATEAAPAEAAEGPIFIGGIHPLTGGLAADGVQMDNAIRMAIDEINAAGGVLGGRQLEYLSADSTGSAEVGQTEAERLINQGAAALICCFQSSVTGNVAAIAEREGVPLVIDVAVADAILDQGYTHVFRIQPNATAMGVYGANYLTELAAAKGEEIKTAAYMFDGTTGYGDSVRAAFAARAAELGIEIVEEIGYDPFGVTDLTTELTRINSLAPDVLLVTGYYNDGLLIARNAEDVGLNVKLVYGVAQGTYDQPQFVADAGDLAECFMDSNYHWDASNPKAQEVRDSFKAQYGEEMRTAAVLSYQATYLIADAIERAASADPGDIRDALAQTDYADHILPYPGPIQFDETGENINATPVLMQVQNATVYQVWPTDRAETEPILPCVSWNK